MKTEIFALFFLIILTSILNGQVSYRYDLDSSTIHITHPVSLNGSLEPPSEFNNINLPLVVEPYSSNYSITSKGDDIHPAAAGVNDVFFGGDIPRSTGGSSAIPIYTKKTFNKSDFPVYIETNFYSDINIPPYNESYLFIIPSDYKYFGSPTYHRNGEILPAEGVLIGGRPFETWIYDRLSISDDNSNIEFVTHNISRNKEWFNMSAVIDTMNDHLIIRDVRINDICIFDRAKDLGVKAWLNNYRLGIAVDDLANSFIIKTNYNSLEPNIIVDRDSICSGECIRLEAMLNNSNCLENNTTFWSFENASLKEADTELINELCYFTEGLHSITLTVNDDFQSSTTSTKIFVKPNPDVDLGEDTIFVCNDESIILDAFDPRIISYDWHDGSTSPTYGVITSGLHYVTAKTSCGLRSDTVEVIIANEILEIHLGDNQELCIGDSIRLNAFSKGAIMYEWQNNSTGPFFNVTKEGNYEVTIKNGCSEVSDDIYISFKDCCNLYIPNIFSPNNDGNNDIFKVFTSISNCELIDDFKMILFDRWGSEVHYSTNIDDEWNGKIDNKTLEEGIYTYVIEYKQSGNVSKIKGTVTIIK